MHPWDVESQLIKILGDGIDFPMDPSDEKKGPWRTNFELCGRAYSVSLDMI